MPFKPNYRFDRAERTRSKETKKMEKLEAQAARRKAGRDAPIAAEEANSAASIELNGDQDGCEHTREKEE